MLGALRSEPNFVNKTPDACPLQLFVFKFIIWQNIMIIMMCGTVLIIIVMIIVIIYLLQCRHIILLLLQEFVVLPRTMSYRAPNVE